MLTGFCFSPSCFRYAASSNVSSGGGVFPPRRTAPGALALKGMSLILHRAAYGRGRRLRTTFLSRRAVADSSAALGVGVTTARELGRVSCRAASHNPISAVELQRSQSVTFQYCHSKYCHSEAVRGGGISFASPADYQKRPPI